MNQSHLCGFLKVERNKIAHRGEPEKRNSGLGGSLQALQHRLTGRIVWTLELELFTRYLAVRDPCAHEGSRLSVSAGYQKSFKKNT